MGSGRHENGVDPIDSYVILEGYGLEGGDPPPDGRSAMAEKAFDRMMAEMNDRHQVESGRLSMNVAFTGVLMTMSAASIIYLLSMEISIAWVIAVLISAVSLVVGVVTIHGASIRDQGLQMAEVVKDYNNHNYELVSYYLFNNKLRTVDHYKELNFNIVGKQRLQIVLFILGLIAALASEVVG